MKQKKALTLSRNNGKTLFYLVLLLLLMLASLAVLQRSQDIRNLAQESNPTPTPLLRCNVACTFNSQCPTGLFCYQGACRNPSCPQKDSCTCLITPTPNLTLPAPTLQPSNRPLPTERQNLETSMLPLQRTPTPAATVSPVLVPTLTFEVPPNQALEEKTLLEAIIHYLRSVLCGLFRAC